MERRVIFAAQATPLTGAGHVMRCLRIAHEFLKSGISVSFYGDTSLKWVTDYLGQELWDSLDSSREYDLMIQDSYNLSFLDSSEQSIPHKARIQIIDSSSPRTVCDGFVWLEAPTVKFVPSHDGPLLASGIQYIPTKDLNPLKVQPEASSILVTLGGSNLGTVLDSVIEAISQKEFSKVKFFILNSVDQPKRLGPNLFFFPQGKSLVELSSSCDTVISASGTSIWDFAANARVLGVVPVVENQISNFRYIVDSKLALSLLAEDDNSRLSPEAINRLLFDSQLRRQLTRPTRLRPDLFGTSRLTSLLVEKFLL